MSTVQSVWEGAGNDDHKPGNLPKFLAPTQTYEDRKVYERLLYKRN